MELAVPVQALAPDPARERGAHGLSRREIEIAHLVAAGHSNKVIAASLEISIWTVGTYLRRIFAKLGVGSRAAMVARMAQIPLQNQQTVV